MRHGKPLFPGRPIKRSRRKYDENKCARDSSVQLQNTLYATGARVAGAGDETPARDTPRATDSTRTNNLDITDPRAVCRAVLANFGGSSDSSRIMELAVQPDAVMQGFTAGLRARERMSDADQRLMETSNIKRCANPLDKMRYMARIKRGEIPLTAADACYLRWFRDTRAAHGCLGWFQSNFGHLDIDSV